MQTAADQIIEVLVDSTAVGHPAGSDRETADLRWEDDVRQAWADAAPEGENVTMTAADACCTVHGPGCPGCAEDDPGFDATAIAKDLVYRQTMLSQAKRIHEAAYAAAEACEALAIALRESDISTEQRTEEAYDAMNAMQRTNGHYASATERYERQVAASIIALVNALPRDYILKAVKA